MKSEQTYAVNPFLQYVNTKYAIIFLLTYKNAHLAEEGTDG